MSQEPLKNGVLNVRVDGDLKRRIAQAFELYGVTEATLVRDSVEAALDYIFSSRGYRRPMKMVLNEENFQAIAAEAAGRYSVDQEKPPKPPDKSLRTRGGGPTHRVSKSA